ETLYIIAVGYNGLPPGTSEQDGERLRALRFADDDAAQVYALFMDGAADGALLATLDAETERKHPGLASVARPATRGELQRAVQRVATRVGEDRRRGLTPQVVFFYSGHGFSDVNGPALALRDGVITTAVLYGDV